MMIAFMTAITLTHGYEPIRYRAVRKDSYMYVYRCVDI